jgi:type II secretory pathway pseudopilin PulG
MRIINPFPNIMRIMRILLGNPSAEIISHRAAAYGFSIPRTSCRMSGNLHQRFNGRKAAYSLLELLAVVALVAILLALLMPAIAGMSGTAGRRGAVNIVMNTIDQARVAALEQGRDVHVVFARRNFPEQDAILVVREPESSNANEPKEKLTRWIPLPKGVHFQEEQGVFEDTNPPISLPDLQKLGSTGSISKIGVLTFGPSGTVQHPKGNDNTRRIHLADAVRSVATEDVARGFDIISVARYTGRPQLDVTFQ